MSSSEHDQRVTHLQPAADVTVLTPREREVAALIAEGLTNAEIAERLTLPPGTVSNHLGHILRALGVRNRAQVAVWAVEQGPYRSGQAEDIGTDAG
jgi:DNA-binding NarL/FixJ family response regulator